jgi:hypothetical protein
LALLAHYVPSEISRARAVYVALLGNSRGVEKLDAIDWKISTRDVTECELSTQVLLTPLPLCR